MDPLIEGYRRFRADVWPAERARYEALAHWGQSPEAMVIACSDSRVDPQTVFGAVPGELFVVRNVAALVPRYSPDPGHHGTSAALEFGVKVLKVAAPRRARARAVRRRQGDGLRRAAAGARLHRLVGRDRQARRSSRRGTSRRDGSSGSRPRSCGCRSPTS